MKQVVNFKYLVASMFVLVLSGKLFSQKIDYSKVYVQAKTELKNKNFDKAMDLFKQVAHQKENPQNINAIYFYAYCALKQKQYWSANHYLNKIIDNNPEWNKLNEVYYLQTQMAFEKHEYSIALKISQKIKSKFLKTDLNNMKNSFLNYPSLKDTVAEIQKKYQNDTCIASILFQLVKDESGWKNNSLTKTLIEKYGFKDSEIQEPKKIEVEEVIEKDTMNIAVVLPFNLSENIKDNIVRKDLYLYDLYTGIKLATDSMRKAGIKIRLTAYDYGQDSSGFYTLIDKPEMTQFDILIGPIQNSFANKISAFAEKNKILVINPLSSNIKFTEGSNWSYLYKSSNETQVIETAKFAYNNFKPKKALIITGKGVKDSLNALLFQKSFESIGGKINGKTSLTVGTLAKIGNLFTKKNLDSTGCIYISNNEQYLAVNIVKKLTELNYTTPLLVSPEWLEFQSFDFQQMQKQNFYFIDPDYVDYQNDTVASITNYLKAKTNSLPSQYTYLGFELIYQISELAKNDSTFFKQPNFKGKFTNEGLLHHGLDYRKGKDNSLFGIYRFTNEGFTELRLNPQD
jgi:ABC-type branched-subunit amino acid transport system substrate-binding protein